jgi:ABC-type xylose transport system permease subunit
MNNNNLSEQELNKLIIRYKKINNRNSGMLIILFAILLFVCVMAIYVRFL